MDELLKINSDAQYLINETDDPKELEQIKQDFLGKKGTLTLAMKAIATMPEDIRPEVGKLANEIKQDLEKKIDEKKTKVKTVTQTISAKAHIVHDVTTPGIRPPLGHLHLVTQAIEEITEIFSKVGFSRVRYPEVEWDYYAFEALNFPENHPARDDWETFFVKADVDPKFGPMILTPHTSSGQIREMENVEPPIRMLNIAKCYRRQSDISHSPMFHQFEGLVVAENISITHLKGVLDYFVKSYFGENRVSRIRPYQFQFTEPSFEVDVSCGICLGKGCRLCKEGWLEMGGAGMVHPNVLRYSKIDSKRYSGFAFGWGVERVLMMKEGLELDDLRMLYSSNLDFLEQF
jgi:phenylalanyl-tRNA synthetase alpha chain